MKEDLYDDLFDEKEEKTDFQALFFKYVIHWPWFIASILICMALAFIYLRYQAPVYEVASSVLIKEDDNKKSANNALAAMQDFGMFSMTSNFDNEVEILTYIIHSGFISGYQNRYGDNLKPPTNVYHRMTA